MPQGARTSGERGGLILGVPAKAQLLTGRKSWAKWPSIWGRKRSSISKFFEKMQKKRPEGRFFLFYLRKTFRARRGGERFRPPGGRTVGPTVSFCKKEMVGLGSTPLGGDKVCGLWPHRKVRPRNARNIQRLEALLQKERLRRKLIRALPARKGRKKRPIPLGQGAFSNEKRERKEEKSMSIGVREGIFEKISYCWCFPPG